ncbi:hypothetical protein [Dysgonomonas reticulitermitis]
MNFNDFYWHDSIIKSIYIDRSNPGKKDEIQLEVELINEGVCILVFKDVYWSSLNLNFGIVAEESILNAKILEKNDVDLANFYSSWNGLMDNLDLKVFLIELNSTGSTIKIIAKDYELINK